MPLSLPISGIATSSPATARPSPAATPPATQSLSSLDLPPFWSGDDPAPLLDSPLRRQLVEKLRSGASTVWILIEGADPAENDQVAERLAELLAEAAAGIAIPDGVVRPEQLDSGEVELANIDVKDVLSSPIPLGIDFQILRLASDDPQELVFRKMLQGSHPNPLVRGSPGPLLVPVFGRGRMLEPLPAPMLNRETVTMASQYLCGECSCELKDENPGADLLLHVDWETILRNSYTIIDRHLPPLAGAGEFTNPAHVPAPGANGTARWRLAAIAKPLPPRRSRSGDTHTILCPHPAPGSMSMITARTLTLREISHRRGNFLLGSLAVAMAICGFALTLARLRAFDAETAAQIEEFERRTATDMATLEDEIRKSMKGLGFNIFIFPKGQELAEVYAEGFASKTMPEEFVTRLAASEVVKVNHLLPSLTQKITWPEQKRTIVLVGTRGEVPIGERAMKAPLIDPVPPGEAVLGFELQQSLGLQAGDQIRLMGTRVQDRTGT